MKELQIKIWQNLQTRSMHCVKNGIVNGIADLYQNLQKDNFSYFLGGFFQTGDLCLGNMDFLGNFHLGLALKKTKPDNIVFTLI